MCHKCVYYQHECLDKVYEVDNDKLSNYSRKLAVGVDIKIKELTEYRDALNRSDSTCLNSTYFEKVVNNSLQAALPPTLNATI
jgi:hypothetical protein